MFSSFNDRLCYIMSERMITSKELSYRTGISMSRISQYRKGIYKPKSEAMKKLADALIVNQDWLEGISDDMFAYPEYKTVQDLTPFEMRLLNQFQAANDNIKQGICFILGIDTKGTLMNFTKKFSDNEINGDAF